MRVTLVHIAVDGNWTISRALRQESDDIIEISGDHLRPYVELIAGAEPSHPDEDADHMAARPLANGHSTAIVASYQPASGNHAPPAIYTAPVVAEYQRPALQLPRAPREDRPRDDRVRDDRARDERGRDDRAREDRAREDRAREDRAVPPALNGETPPAARPEMSARPDIYATPVTGARSRPDRAEPAPPSPAVRSRAAEDVVGYAPSPAAGAPEAGSPSGLAAAPAPENQAPPGQRRLPSSRGANQGQPGPMGVTGVSGPAPMAPVQHGGQGSARSAPYSGPQPVVSPAGPGYQNAGAAAPGVSLSEAVQAAHEEGQEFGGSVARDAPALWLEAVLARKPRMPSDLEARLLQGSALPIDFLLHDEVRHALRRGFWDALERTRR